MSSSNGTSPPQQRTERVRTERASKCVQDAHIDAPVRTSGSSGDAHENTISRTEQPATTALRPPGPLDLGGTARVLTARLLNEALTKHWQAREAWASNRCIADHYCENTESVVRRWRNGEKSIPLAALAVLPAPLAEHLARSVLKSRGIDMRQSMGTLAEAVDAIGAPVAPDDVDEVRRALREARDRIIARLDRLNEEGK